MRYDSRSPFTMYTPQLSRPGVATKWFCGLMMFVSIIGALTDRRFGIGSSALVLHMGGILHGELWRLLTYAFVKTTPFGLMMSALVMWMLGGFYESSWGTRYCIKFFCLSTVGAALFAIPIHYLANILLPFNDVGFAEGPDAVINAMLVAMTITAPNANILFGFILPIPAKKMIGILLASEVVVGLMTGTSNLSITLGGMLMGYLLTTGYFRPSVLWRLWCLYRQRKNLYVVPPKKRTLN